MAGDWIKIEKCLSQKPEVYQIAQQTGLDPWSVVGRLIEVWSWADAQTDDGRIDGIVPALIDRIAGFNGFAAAMAATRPAAWLLVDEHGITLPAYERHNGKSAKKRATNTRRQQDWRATRGITPPPQAAWRHDQH